MRLVAGLSLPVRGVGVEIPTAFHGRRWQLCRSPYGERGLKFLCPAYQGLVSFVTPRTGSVV